MVLIALGSLLLLDMMMGHQYVSPKHLESHIIHWFHLIFLNCIPTLVTALLISYVY